MRTRVDKSGTKLYEFCWWTEAIDSDGYSYLDSTIFVFTEDDLRELKQVLEEV